VRTLFAAACLAALCWAPATRAHSDAHFDQNPAPHGGQVRMAGPYHLELVLGKNEVTLYLTDHGDSPVDATGGSGKAILTTGRRKRSTVVLEHAEGNMLRGVGEFTATSATTVTVIVKLPDQEPQQAQFKPVRKATKATKPKPK
jgi:hypothetical protein